MRRRLAGVMLSALLCDNGFDIYGFDDGEQPKGTKYHYYDDAVANGNLDDFSASQQLLTSIASSEPECIRIRE